MAFICKDCRNKSTKKFPGGKCPACDSFNVKNTSSTKEAIREKEPKTLIEIVILCLVWGGLIFGVWDRYLKPEPLIASSAAEDVKAATPATNPDEQGLDY